MIEMSHVVTSKLLIENEGAGFEVKSSMPTNDALAAVMCAFANTAGGRLLIGATDAVPREAVGVSPDEAILMEQKICSIGATNLSPSVIPFVKLMNMDGRCLLVVDVERGYQRPYCVCSGKDKNAIFVRVGASTRRADTATVRRLQLVSSGISWDSLPCPQTTVTDLDKGIIRNFLAVRTDRRNIPPPRGGYANWLKKMNFTTLSNGQTVPTMAGVLMFHPSPASAIPQSGLEMARFQGIAAKDFADKQSADKPVWQLYDAALDFFSKHIPVQAIRTNRGRIERPAYPIAAFREFMVNSLCHRSWEEGSGPVRLAIFDDVIEITSSGTLPEGLELDDLGAGISVLRNPVIARAFNEIGLIEGWGTGIRLAQAELAGIKLPPAEVKLKGLFTQISSVWRWPSNLDPAQQKILEMAAANGQVTAVQVADLLQVSDRTARNRLSTLATEGLLVKIGATKNAKYHLT